MKIIIQAKDKFKQYTPHIHICDCVSFTNNKILVFNSEIKSSAIAEYEISEVIGFTVSE